MKVGILTLYYNNSNYGGLLQSYALVNALCQMGIESEQICFDEQSSLNPLLKYRLDKKEKIKKYGFSYVIFAIKTFVIKENEKKKLSKVNRIDELLDCIAAQRKTFKEFEENKIPHSEVVYDAKSIYQSIDKYDVFICGSDQIWNPLQIRDEYLLKFVDNRKKKIAYSASISRATLNEAEQKYISDALKDFSAISVREETGKAILNKGLLLHKVTCMPDPTLLLTQQDWDNLIKEKNANSNKQEPYILCYFLGDNRKQRKIVEQLARDKGLRIIGFPHILGKVRSADIGFKCEEQYNCSPSRFIWLIKNAQYVITDSFHATVFSVIYHRKFVVFNRDRTSFENNMKSRLLDLLEPLDLKRRIVPNSLTHVRQIIDEKEDFFVSDERLRTLRAQGIQFLKQALDVSDVNNEN